MEEKVVTYRATASQQGGSHCSHNGLVEEFRLQDEEQQSSAFTWLLRAQQLPLTQFPTCLHLCTELYGLRSLLPVTLQRHSYKPDCSFTLPRWDAWSIKPPRLFCRWASLPLVPVFWWSRKTFRWNQGQGSKCPSGYSYLIIYRGTCWDEPPTVPSEMGEDSSRTVIPGCSDE